MAIKFSDFSSQWIKIVAKILNIQFLTWHPLGDLPWSDLIAKKGRGLTAPPTPKAPTAKFASQGGANLRTDIQIKFLYYSLVLVEDG